METKELHDIVTHNYNECSKCGIRTGFETTSCKPKKEVEQKTVDPPVAEICWFCKWWAKDQWMVNKDVEISGGVKCQCLRHAPVLSRRAVGDETSWPMVFGDRRCGDWEAE